MSNLKHLSLKTLKEEKADCEKYLEKLDKNKELISDKMQELVRFRKKYARAGAKISGQQERLKWINKYIDDYEEKTEDGLPSHSPHPWKVTKRFIDSDDYDNIYYIEDQFGETVCDLYYRFGPQGYIKIINHPNAENNCHLLTAAPQLLEVLELLVEKEFHYIDEEYNLGQKIIDVIKKAKGK